MSKDDQITREDASPEGEGRRGRVPESVEAGWFALQERVIWPLQDRFSLLGPGPNRTLIGGGALALLAVVALVVALSSGGPSAPTTRVVEVATPSQPSSSAPTQAEPKPEPPRQTLHGAAPVFSPPSPASKGGEKTGNTKAAAHDAQSNETSESTSSTSGDATSTSPAAATISSDPNKSTAQSGSTGSAKSAAAARATAAPDGPPAGPAALKVAREFAQGFVVYETGGEAAEFRDAFKASATPQLTRALLQRPPKQPAGVRVPRAKVLNVVAGPSQGSVYKVSVSLLRVGVTSELRLDMEKQGRDGWRVTNVLG